MPGCNLVFNTIKLKSLSEFQTGLTYHSNSELAFIATVPVLIYVHLKLKKYDFF